MPEPLADVEAAAEEAPVLVRDDVGPRVVRGGAVRVAGFAASNLLAVGASVLLLRSLGVAEYGRYATVLSLVAIVSALTDAGLTATATRELSHPAVAHDRRDLLRSIVGIRAALTSAGVALAVGFAAAAGYDRTQVLGTAVAGAGAVLVALQGAMLLPLTVDLRNARLALSEVVKQAVMVAGFVAFALAGAGMLSFLSVQILVGVVGIGLVPVFAGRESLVRPSYDRGRWLRLGLQALPVAAAYALGVIYFRLLIVLMSLLSDPVQTGYFATSFRIVETLSALPLLLNGVVLPVLSAAAADDLRRLRYVTQRMTEVAVLAGMLLALPVAVASGPIVIVLGGHQFAGAAGVLRIQAFALVTVFVIQAGVVALIAQHRERALAAVTAAGLVPVIVLGAILVPAYESHGAAAAAVGADVVLATMVLVALRRTPGGAELDLRFVARVALAAAAAAALPQLLPVPSIVQAALTGACFALAAWALRLVPSEIRDALTPPWRAAR